MKRYDENTQKIIRRLDVLRKELHHGTSSNQHAIDDLAKELAAYQSILRPGEKDENLSIVDEHGVETGVQAPRWLAHLLGLSHQAVDIILKWQHPQLGQVAILQVRSWDKDNSPGCLDISAGGHPKFDQSVEEAAFSELEEELGLRQEHLQGRKLECIKKYFIFEEKVNKAQFYNAEWRYIYTGLLNNDALEAIHFQDKEVAGLTIMPIKIVKNLPNQSILPVASGLKHSLPYCKL